MRDPILSLRTRCHNLIAGPRGRRPWLPRPGSLGSRLATACRHRPDLRRPEPGRPVAAGSIDVPLRRPDRGPAEDQPEPSRVRERAVEARRGQAAAREPEIEDRLVQEQIDNGELTARLDDARNLLRDRGIDPEVRVGSNRAATLESILLPTRTGADPDPPRRSAARSGASRRSPASPVRSNSTSAE